MHSTGWRQRRRRASSQPGSSDDTVMDTLPDSVALDTTGDGRVDTIKRLVNERDQYSS